ncbi:hypothetical protein [Aureibacter tunicatorum]|uniref:Uncharacterized protein n=1 Tax=Aureibacter tunicatorum TaxID=866807 RepID=A0AAE3XLM1_9BACT|nr:hypothetical protein [Aureibacter tunicatorum]MDR6238200.1 hypothetical protein [Aureibacter tunicatorum]BDD03233.1 hypothetical protein AUTU_07160 [Aureibacter tunicatorum]
MNSVINIVIFVDVISALSEGSLHGSIFLMDDSEFQSQHEGSSELMTHCATGQLVKWKIYAIDVQTPVEIKSISFGGVPIGNVPQEESAQNGDSKVWSGYVPTWMEENKSYSYQLEVQMGKGECSDMLIDTASLVRVSPSLSC